MSGELTAFFGMMLCGAVCGMAYDFFRGIHLQLKKYDIIVMMTDVIYWSFATAAIMWSLWYFNTGSIRAYEITGLIIGAVLYFFTVGRFVYGFFGTTVKNFVRFIRFICKILLTLWGFLYKILVVPVRTFFEKINNLRI